MIAIKGHNNNNYVKVDRQIPYQQVRVIKDGEQLGVMPTNKALDIAYSNGLNLVVVAPHANPPVCSIMDYSKYKYEQKIKKKEQQQKSKNIESKEIRLRPVTEEHDLDTKIGHLKKFLSEGRTVQVVIMFKAREMMFKENGHRIMKKLISSVEDIGVCDRQPHFDGKNLSVRIMPNKDK